MCGGKAKPRTLMNTPVRTLYKIDAGPDGPAQARRIVVQECSRRVSAQTLEDFELLVSELVTNRILHGQPGADNTVLLDLRMNAMLCCAVCDHGSGAGHRSPLRASRLWPGSAESRTAVARTRYLGAVCRRYRSLVPCIRAVGLY